MLREAGKDGRVVDYTGLENRHTATCRGFESLSFRRCFTFSLLWHIAIPRTLEARRKEAGFLRIKLYKPVGISLFYGTKVSVLEDGVSRVWRA